MQTSTEDCGRQTHEQIMIEIDTEAHSWLDFALWAISFMSLQCAKTCLFVIYCNGYLSCVRLFMSVQLKNKAINSALLTLQLKLSILGTHSQKCVNRHRSSSSSRWLKRESVSLQSQLQCGFFKAVVRGSSFTSHKEQGGWTSTSTGLCSRAVCNLTKQSPPAHTDKHTILDCMLLTGICKLSKLQMIACSFLACHYQECNQVPQSCLSTPKTRKVK